MFLNNKIYLVILGIIFSQLVFSQVPTIEILEQGRKTSIRGMSVVNNNVVWVSGSSGSVGKSLDGGKTWNWITVAGYEKSDFRDIEAFDDKTALIMGITQPAVILKTKDGGLSWRKVFQDTTKAAFLDAMDFAGKKGYVIGDPLDQHLYMVTTKDGGENWEKTKPSSKTKIFAGTEAFFASSGTNIVAGEKLLKNKILFVSGGSTTRLFTLPQDPIIPDGLPIVMGGDSRGANSIAISPSEKYGMIVGGDFAIDSISSVNSAKIIFRKTFNEISSPQIAPHGYRSCVIFIDDNHLITCGTSGVDISKDGGMNWELISKESFHVVQKAKKGNAVFLAGKGGRIAKFNPTNQ
ncbi:MAG: oxidoreductase [Sphingobacteriia bacterium]|nr:MAG: oxidoreductase [Sphingobacteriia bacterium]